VLEAFGIGRRSELVYVAMLKDPEARIGDIARETGLSEAEVHEAFDELSRLRLLRPSWESPGKLRAVSPDVGIESLLVHEEAELHRRQSQIERGRAALATLLADLSTQPGTAHIELDEAIGLDATRAKLEQLTALTRFQVLSLMPDGPQTPDNMEASKPLDESLLRRGVAILTVYLDSVRNDPPTRAYANWLAAAGGEVRTTYVLPLRMLIFDRETAVLPLHIGRSGDGIVVLRGEGPITAMCVLFDQIWQTAVPLGAEASTTPECPLTPQERAVLGLLIDGDTDDVLARKLGVSRRTIGRIVSEIMGKAGARSRFQAGVYVAMQGWHRLRSVNEVRVLTGPDPPGTVPHRPLNTRFDDQQDATH
jgi:DNA-binding CsgD family transcriptional regulator/sugar-specific transcriptional regulator TrmB